MIKKGAKNDMKKPRSSKQEKGGGKGIYGASSDLSFVEIDGIIQTTLKREAKTPGKPVREGGSDKSWGSKRM